MWHLGRRCEVIKVCAISFRHRLLFTLLRTILGLRPGSAAQFDLDCWDLAIGKYVRRKDNQLVRNERIILAAGLALSSRGDTRFHGYSLTELWKASDGQRNVMNYATMYRCLNRLEERGLLESDYEQRETSGPPRRMFSMTGKGRAAATEIETSDITDELALFAANS